MRKVDGWINRDGWTRFPDGRVVIHSNPKKNSVISAFEIQNHPVDDGQLLKFILVFILFLGDKLDVGGDPFMFRSFYLPLPFQTDFEQGRADQE